LNDKDRERFGNGLLQAFFGMQQAILDAGGTPPDFKRLEALTLKEFLYSYMAPNHLRVVYQPPFGSETNPAPLEPASCMNRPMVSCTVDQLSPGEFFSAPTNVDRIYMRLQTDAVRTLLSCRDISSRFGVRRDGFIGKFGDQLLVVRRTVNEFYRGAL
jgi:hypothetical protein